MGSKQNERAKGATEHTAEAIKLLEQSNLLHRAEKEGLLEKGVTTDLVLKLNKQAIEEIEKAIKFQKEFFAEQDKKKAVENN